MWDAHAVMFVKVVVFDALVAVIFVVAYALSRQHAWPSGLGLP